MPLSWISRNSGNSNLIIFVHGLSGNESTFRNSADIHYSSLLGDEIGKSADFAAFIYSSTFYSSKLRRAWSAIKHWSGASSSPRRENKGIATYAKLLRTEIDALPSQYNTLHFIAHSLGGIVVKQMLIDEPFDQTRSTGLYCTFATPHRGAALALLGGPVNPHIAELIPNSAFIVSLEDKWRENGAQRCRAECHFIGAYDSVVPEMSSIPRGTDNAYYLEAGHTEICKPQNETDPGVILLRKHLTEAFRGEKRVDPSADPFFISYKPSHEIWYLRTNRDQLLESSLHVGNTWVVGASGVGKTNVVQRHLTRMKSKVIYVDLSPLRNDSGVAEFEESLFERCKLSKVIDGSIDAKSSTQALLENISRTIPDQNIALVFDEICVDGSQIVSASTDFLLALARTVSKLHDGSRFRILVSSIYSPFDSTEAQLTGELNAYFNRVDFPLWEIDELKALLALLRSSVALNLSDAESHTLVAACSGLPRKLKTALRQLQLRKKPGGASFAEVKAVMTTVNGTSP